MKVNQTTNICPRLKPVQLPLVGKCLSINSATRIFSRKAMMTGISSVRSWVMVICSLIPRAYLNSYFLAKIRTNCEYEHVRCGGKLWAGVTGCPLECSNFPYGHNPHYGRRFFRVFLSAQSTIQRLSRPGMRHILGPVFMYPLISFILCSPWVIALL